MAALLSDPETKAAPSTNDKENSHLLSSQNLLRKPTAGPFTNDKENLHILNSQNLAGISIQAGEGSKISINVDNNCTITNTGLQSRDD